jgi:hypothetical protein
VSRPEGMDSRKDLVTLDIKLLVDLELRYRVRLNFWTWGLDFGFRRWFGKERAC